MGDVIRKKIFRYETASVILALVLFIYIICAVSWNISYNGDERGIRININQLLSQLQKSDFASAAPPSSLPDIEYPYCVFGSDGKVLVSTMDSYSPNQTVDLSTLGSCYYYSVPIVHDNSVTGILMVDAASYRKDAQTNLLILEALAALLIILGILLCQYRIRQIIRQDIWKPISEIHSSTRSILTGNLEQVVNYDYSGEIGELCHDFEQMRDTIRDSYIREKQSREKERILYASLSHDLKTPISIITGYLEQIRYGVAASPEDIQNTAEHALQKTKVLNKFIDDILEHSKAQLDQLSIQLQEVYAERFFTELLQQYKNEALGQHYTLTYMAPPAVLILIDPDRIAQVVQNIVGNAVKYSNYNLVIDISFEIMKPDESSDKRILIVNIKDNGRGIDAADLPFIFDLFYRGNKARTQNIPGSGMGLNISKYIIEKHGGNIECDSIMDAGTTISFSLPIV